MRSVSVANEPTFMVDYAGETAGGSNGGDLAAALWVLLCHPIMRAGTRGAY
jgi:hypothetical protein